MKKFEFRTDNALQLDIAGHEFTIDALDVETVKKMQSFAAEAIAKGEAMKDSEDYAAAVIEACEFCGNGIDELLGEGAYKKIFTGRKVNFIDHLDVMNFIGQQVSEFRAQRFGSYSPNRAQRRAGK